MIAARSVHRGGRTRRAFTLVELLVVLAIVGTLLGLVAAVAGRARGTAQAARCLSNLRQWGIALNLYASDHDGVLPRRGQGVQPLFQIQRPEDWFNCLPPYVGQPGLQEAVATNRRPKPGENSLFVCPAARDEGGAYFLPYAMNMYLSPWIRPEPHRRQELDAPATLAFLADGPGAWASAVPSSQGYSVRARHPGGRANVCFVDGHVASFDGAYLGCGRGEPKPALAEVRWQTGTNGVNQDPVP